jgi:hypothetical protein
VTQLKALDPADAKNAPSMVRIYHRLKFLAEVLDDKEFLKKVNEMA